MRDLKILAIGRDAKTTHAQAKAYADNTNWWQLDLLDISHAATHPIVPGAVSALKRRVDMKCVLP